MNKNYILLVLIFITTSALSQSIVNRDITWNAAKSVELHSNVDVVKPSKLITRGTSQIEWVTGEDVLTFIITSVDGTWTSPNQTGSLVYHVTYQDRPGKITIERSTDITAIIDFTESAPEALQQKILIDSFE
jgi:hypothetical protein